MRTTFPWSTSTPRSRWLCAVIFWLSAVVNPLNSQVVDTVYVLTKAKVETFTWIVRPTGEVDSDVTNVRFILLGFTPANYPTVISPNASDPRVHTPSVIAFDSLADMNGDGLDDAAFSYHAYSLLDVGTYHYRVECEYYYSDEDNGPCGWVNYWDVIVYNSWPEAAPTLEGMPAIGSSITLKANANLDNNGEDYDNDPAWDPNPGPLIYSWRIVAPQSPSVSFSPGSTPEKGLTFADERDIGEWHIEIDIDDDEGERMTFNVEPFEIVNQVPTLTINGSTTLNAGEAIALSASTTSDPDGGPPLTLSWDILEAPPTAGIGAQSGYSADASISIDPDSDRNIGTWRFQLTATDNEGESVTAVTTVTVRNQLPVITLNGPATASIEEGQSFTVSNVTPDDPDGGSVTHDWELIQAPSAANEVPRSSFGTSSTLTLTAPAAGSWIFKLHLRDNEQEEDTEVVRLLVDAAVEASVTGLDRIAQLAPLTLDGNGSIDRDSPPGGTLGHRTSQPPPQVSEGVVSHRWSLIEFPAEYTADYIHGTVDYSFGAWSDRPIMEIPAGSLKPGNYTFELVVSDGEGNTDAATHSVLVVEPNAAPVALVSPDQFIITDAAGVTGSGIIAEAGWSFDPDNLINSAAAPGLGIANYSWQIVRQPPGCAAGGAPPAGLNANAYLLYVPGSLIPLNCHGVWALQVTVTDDDTPALSGVAPHIIAISNCAAEICIDNPTTSAPQKVDLVDNTDVTILYHLNSAIYDSFVGGVRLELALFHETDLTNPVYTGQFDYDVLPVQMGGSPKIHWHGYTGNGLRPAAGKYSMRIRAANPVLPAPYSEAIEFEAIWLEVTQVTIAPASDAWVSTNGLRNGADQLNLNFSVSAHFAANAEYDAARLRVRQSSSGAEVITVLIGNPSGGTVAWNGELTSGIYLAPGEYTAEIEVSRAGTVIATSEPHVFTAYRLELVNAGNPAVALSTSAPGKHLFVNNDDENGSGVSDLGESGYDDHDLYEVKLIMEPAVRGSLALFSGAGGMRAWSTATKENAINLPAYFNVPAEPLPARVYLEATDAKASDLTLSFTPQDGALLQPFIAAFTLVDVQVLADANDNHTVDASDVQVHHTDIGLWEDAYDAARNVRNSTTPNHFVDQDGRRIYLRIRDPLANANAGAIEQITARIGTLTGTGLVDDDLTEVPLRETSANSAEFVSQSHMLTSPDIQTADDPNADDELPAHDGVSGNVTDDAAGDRTHRATMDGSLRVQYQAVGTAAPRNWDMPVCQRVPDARRRVQLRVTILLEPYRDTGYYPDLAGPLLGDSNGIFDYADLNNNGQHDAGEPSEVFIDLSNGGEIYRSSGSRGGVASQAELDAELERANIAWAQACIRAEVIETRWHEAPETKDSVNILDDTQFSLPREDTIMIRVFAPAATEDVIEVFYVPDIYNAPFDPLGATSTPSSPRPGLGEKTFIYLKRGNPISYRTLAHELGHALTNRDHSGNNHAEFFPLGGNLPDTAVNQARRLPPATITDARTLRPAGDMQAVGNRLLKPF